MSKTSEREKLWFRPQKWKYWILKIAILEGFLTIGNFQSSLFSLLRPKSKFWSPRSFILVPRTWLPSFKQVCQKMEKEIHFKVAFRRIGQCNCMLLWLGTIFFIPKKVPGSCHSPPQVRLTLVVCPRVTLKRHLRQRF